jgi:hypothetical protein
MGPDFELGIILKYMLFCLPISCFKSVVPEILLDYSPESRLFSLNELLFANYLSN